MRPPHLPSLRRAYTTAPPPPPPPPQNGAARLTDRALISVRGPDAPKFLQGLVTSQVPPPPPTGKGTYSCFLNSQGRVLSDAFIYPREGQEPAYLLDLSAPAAPHILATLRRRRLRSNISLDAVAPSTLSVWAVWGAHPPLRLPAHPDDRAPGFGARVVAAPGEVAPLDAGEVALQQYTLRRYLWGVADGGEMPLGVALPQQSNVDYMGGVDYRKGCYVGQELTIRTHHTGVVRKRVLPVQFSGAPFAADGVAAGGAVVYDPGVVLPAVVAAGDAVRRVRGRARDPGVVLGRVGNVGLALCRLGTMTEEGGEGEGEWRSGDQFVVGGEGGEVWVRAVVPWWHRERAEALRRR